ncbi:MAG: flagellar hook-basal body complex protein FliE [Aquificaceae bacterium]|jgi:flagellar hook-basal body complex protein FliE|uniref:flagellar hook-basal body complex protein FliE n=1 Tax=Hydrogenobacter sp. Uz 6-8 TaxID=3384828 RepID=UPI000F0EC22F|nr:MAG: flagellar hook-basal body complex protein FliE [Aquificota bacterium]
MEIRAVDGLLKQRLSPQRGERGDFLQELGRFVQWVNKEQQKSDSIREAVLRGAEIPLHQMVIEFEKARTALNLLIQVRNKLLEAFQELNRMQV